MSGSRKVNRSPRLLLRVLLSVVFFTGAVSAETLRGKITDKTSGKPLVGATVIVSSSDVTEEAMTDDQGSYEVGNLTAGVYHVEISFLGFATQVVNELDLAADSQLDIALPPTAINIESIGVTASRRREKLLDAPASISVVKSEAIIERGVLTPTEHLKGLPAVDIASTGLNQSNVVVRGFNNVFSGALLVLTDNRIARVPSLRYNAYNFISTTNEDIERIEVVSGPGSALYGPNSATGVMHILTKSPFTWQGTTVSVGGGEREIGMTSVRHAGVLGDKVGYKVTGQFYRGLDWKHSEPKESPRDFDIEKFSGEARIDYLLSDDATLKLGGGINRSSGIELTGLGAGQAIDWTYSFAQARLTYKDLFAQGFVNMSDAGDTYLLNTGMPIADKSKLYVGQVQHSYRLGEKHRLTYGLDVLLTRPATDGTINGRNENDDDINEYGLYLQSESQLTEKFKLVGAARLDDNNRLKDVVFSPRAALVYKPDPTQTFRATFNRAFDTPDNNNLFLDLVQLTDLGDIGQKFQPSLGFSPAFDVRVQGVPETGFHWRMGDAGPDFRSPFAPSAGMSTSDYIPYNDLGFTNVMWTIGRGAVLSNAAVLLAAKGYDADTLALFTGALNAVAPDEVSGVDNILMIFNPNDTVFEPFAISGLQDINRLEPTITQTFELGYKGIVNNSLAFAVDVYYTKKNDFIGPLTIETPNVFLDPATLQTYLGPQFGAGLADSVSAGQMTLLDYLDTMAIPGVFIGDSNGSPIEELTALFTQGAASIPFGTVTPDEAFDPDALLVTYRNFGDIDFFGADLSISYHLNQNWDFSGTYSWVSDILWEKSADQPHDINLNAPKHKVGLGLQYHNSRAGFSASTRARWVDSFRMASPFVGTVVPAYTIVDLNLGYDIPTAETRLTVTIQNLFDDRHIEFIGGANLGRLTIARLTRTF